MSLLHYSSTRRPAALKDSDYDHEILLVDGTQLPSSTQLRTRSSGPETSSRSETPESQHSNVHLQKSSSLRENIAHRKYKKYQPPVKDIGSEPDERDAVSASGPVAQASSEGGVERGRSRTTLSMKKRRRRQHRESAIEVLFENQRGGFLCGLALFSSKALGAADAPPWTNIAQKPSATNITNAQPPDPSWVWAWKEWKINHTEEVDEDGWEYSFMFSKKFSWHGPTWYNSFVRRRAWIRKRMKLKNTSHVQEAHMLSADYFTIHPNIERSRSQSTSRAGSVKYSNGSLARCKTKEVRVKEEICDIGHLMRVLMDCRIDREKVEAVENFVDHAEDEIYYLKERMHHVMSHLIFQASRRFLLSRLSHLLDGILADEEEKAKDGEEPNMNPPQRKDWLATAVMAADEAVKKLEFWSDIRDMAEKGETQGAVDEAQGWDKSWAGLDASAPKDVISDRKLLNKEEDENAQCNGSEEGGVNIHKGKEKA
ncbi:MAG: hypothetical protein M1818_000261 [Claussenomyces sp. TS43310]|nr:MAG: hypothetical protein M1818_000261 [Claussenomyces sp. TS43310]